MEETLGTAVSNKNKEHEIPPVKYNWRGIVPKEWSICTKEFGGVQLTRKIWVFVSLLFLNSIK